MIAPPAGDDPHLLKAVEDFAVEQFISQTGIEAFDSRSPMAAGLDIEGNDAKPAESLAHRISDELGAVAHWEAALEGAFALMETRARSARRLHQGGHDRPAGL
jgi:hypothetical protein